MSVAAIQEALRKLKGLPAAVESWQVEVGPDATGDDAVWVWVVLRDENQGSDARAALRDRVRSEVERVETPKPKWVYVRFRGASEVEAEAEAE
ncbi:MAG: hypothetical protein K8I02_06095 [Candidatus Methylomirabilis sp.]|nr:hypothetical protein [Deltaproteobacteria bacterium]